MIESRRRLSRICYFLRVKSKRLQLALLTIAAGFLAALALRSRENRPPRTDWPVNVAHRGASIRKPENTLEAFRRAVEEGAAGLELDAHMSRDGVVVVIHDDTVDRTTDGRGPVREKSLAEIKTLNAGHRFSRDSDPGFPYREKEVGLPTLWEVYQEFPEAMVNLEIKEDLPGIEDAVLRVIEEAGAQKRTLVASQKHRLNKRFRKVSGGKIPTSASQFEIGLFYLLSRVRLERLLKPAYAAIQVPQRYRGFELLTPRFLAATRNRDVRVDAWTIDDPDEMSRLLDLGVDVIMTNRPRVLSEVLERRNSVRKDH